MGTPIPIGDEYGTRGLPGQARGEVICGGAGGSRAVLAAGAAV